MKRAQTLRALGVAAVAISLAGCMKVDMQVELNTDDTVDGTMVFALSRDMVSVAESMGEDTDSLFDEMNGDLPEGTTAEAYEDGDFVGQRYVFDGASLDEFAPDEEGFGITHENGEFVVNGEMDMSDFGDTQGLEEQLGADLEEFGGAEGLMESFDVRLSITFPGEVIEHNGELDGTTVTWTPTPGENLEISARAQDSGGGGGVPVWLWILIAVVVIGLVGLLFVLSRSRNNTAAEPAGAAGAAPAPATTPDPPAAPGGHEAGAGEAAPVPVPGQSGQTPEQSGQQPADQAAPAADATEEPGDSADSSRAEGDDGSEKSEQPS